MVLYGKKTRTTHRERKGLLIILLSVLTLQVGFATAKQEVISYEDPLENMNRAVFTFNDWVDSYTLKPIARGYDAITPQPMQIMVTNVFSNLGEVRNTLNALLQLEGKKAGISVSRLLVNSTLGFFGLFDVASSMGLNKKYNDFGITLAKWGTPSGPYLVLPFLGPRTVRSGIGLVPDSYSNPVNYVEPERDRWIIRGVNMTNTRAGLLNAEDLIMGDRYRFIRDAYLQRREYMITGKPPEDDF
ncbi:putative phospholipid-binding lipoprotein MlaA [invertebrate metagenome]|uniref:Putative phospholipid-binding lipoprotein MlaA n=1 Tax=invertebrate metagenome TaxID=1711999 RepID=A0A2H9T5R4_9ZZZZ